MAKLCRSRHTFTAVVRTKEISFDFNSLVAGIKLGHPDIGKLRVSAERLLVGIEARRDSTRLSDYAKGAAAVSYQSR